MVWFAESFSGRVMSIDPFRLCLGLGPVAMYLLLLGAINLSRRSLLVSGVRDGAALALAASGLIIVGPMELFYPFDSAIALGGSFAWVLLVALYVMCVLLWLLLLRPRLVIYNSSAEKMRPILADVVSQFDADARWAGDSLVIPGLGVQLHIDGFAFLRCVSLVSAGGHQSHAGWRRLEGALRAALAREEAGRNPRGLLLVFAGLLCMAVIVLAIERNPEAVARSLLNIAPPSLLKLLGW
jgi:hypothetical protein